MRKQKAVTARREPALQAIARIATLRANKGKHGPLFGEVSVVAGGELVRHFFDELLDRVLKKGERVRLAGVGTFYAGARGATAKRPEVTHHLAFSAAVQHRGLPKKGGAA